MKAEAQRITIAEACGFSDVHKGVHPFNQWRNALLGIKGKNERHEIVPDYLSDLNVMHEAEKVLTLQQLSSYQSELAKFFKYRTGYKWSAGFKEAICSTSFQRAEAFLRTIGKWEDDK